jgi:tetratricopeptide (TPR) repeat protein
LPAAFEHLRRPSVLLVLILALDALLLGSAIVRAWPDHVLLQIPGGDAEEYWNWSARIASGDWISSTPFLSAPLYPYALALLRAGGGGLLAVYLVQALLRSLTAYLLYRAAARRFGHPGYGLASALLFLLLLEPAFYASRVLNCEIQLALLAGLLLVCPLDAAQRSRGRLIGTGILLGLNVLANPSMLLLLPALPLWLGWRPRQGLGQAGLVAACALLAIAPATLHNFLATRQSEAGPELILVSAQSGITYAHGNGPGAIGVYHGLPGVSQLRLIQNQEAYAAAQAATGRPGWKSADRYFRGQAVDWLLANPAAAFELHLRKLAYLFVGQDYGDLYNISLEAADADLPRTVPPTSFVQTGWILPAALAGAVFLLLRRGRAAAPDVALLVLPCLIVILFWFSPRYRMPLIPAACLLAPFGAVQLARLVQRPLAVAGLAVLLLIPIAGRAAAASSGFDNAERYRPEYEYHLGHQLHQWRRHEAAIARLTQSLEAGFEPATVLETRGRARMDLGLSCEQAGQTKDAARNYQEGLADFGRCLELDPQQLDVWVTRGNLLRKLGQTEKARRDLQEAVRLAEARGDAALAASLRARIASLDAPIPARQ